MKTSAKYFVRQQGKHITGPYRVDQLRQLIEQGRLRPDMEFSEDRRDWGYGIELPHLFPAEWRRRKISSWYCSA